MKQIRPKASLADLVLGKQQININEEYRLLSYVHTCNIDNGLLLYNLLTKELIFSESINLYDPYLIENWFSVPSVFNDKALCDELRQTALQLSNKCNVTDYKIMTTTGCNARCFYCFEKGIEQISMTEQTAMEVADYVIKKSEGKKVTISWFGGEPLYNFGVMDIISKKLLESNIEFSSDMFSNGYLFDSDMIDRAVNIWNLKKVQITLDGTEEVYNRAKNYIYPEVNAYRVVLNNIEELLKAGVSVTARLNMDLYNADDLLNLSNVLAERYSGYKNFSCYVQPLFEGCGTHLTGRTLEQRDLINEKYAELYEHIKSKGIYSKLRLQKKPKVFACAADSPNSLSIYPDGRLWKCDHFSNGEDIGSIYSDKFDFGIINSWKKLRYYDDCNSCKFYPECIIPEKCLEVLPGCYPSDRKIKEKMLEDTMIRVYNKRCKDEI